MLQLRLVRGEGEVVAERNLAPAVAGHSWENRAVTWVDEDVVSMSEPGDFYEVRRHVGGGGGHQLFVNNFELGVRQCDVISLK